MTRIIRRTPPQGSPELASALKIIAELPPSTIVYREEEEEVEGGSKVDHLKIIAKYKAKVSNRATAIRAKCIECSGGVLSEVRECRVVSCALHPFRAGTDPFNKKTRDRLSQGADAHEGESGSD